MPRLTPGPRFLSPAVHTWSHSRPQAEPSPSRRRAKRRTLPFANWVPTRSPTCLYSVRTVRHSGSTYTLSGNAGWATFSLALTLPPGQPGLLHFVLSLSPTKSAPVARRSVPDVQVIGAPASSITLYDPAPPIAGSSLFVSNKRLGSSVLYLANLTTLGTFFDRSQTGASQPNFDFPRAGGKGGLVGLNGSYFGYPPPVNSLDNLPRGKSTRVIDSYLYLAPGFRAMRPAWTTRT